MRADRILVVGDGTIIEDGCHDELLKLKGKYYDLWSKQILETPNAKGSPVANSPKPVSRSPFRRAVTASTTVTTCPNSPQKLKANAPEFIPQKSRASVASGSSSKIETKQDMKEKLKKDKEQKSRAKDARKASNGAEDNKSITSGTEGKLKFRYPRFRRHHRHESKSDPSTRTMDGATDWEDFRESGSAENSQHRHVSAPIGLPSLSNDDTAVSTDVPAPSTGAALPSTDTPLSSTSSTVTMSGAQGDGTTHRARRTRHWRIQKQARHTSAATSEGSVSRNHSTGSMTGGQPAPFY
jgi:hypothetical protein